MRITNPTNWCFNSAWTVSVGISLTVVCFLIFGCGGSPRNDPYRIAELKPSGTGKSTVPRKSVEQPSSLPASAEINRGQLRPLVETFESQQPQNLNALNATSVGRAYSLTIVSNCDLNVLKGFIARRWAPIVSLRTSGRPRLWAVVGYGQAGDVTLENPVDNRRKTLSEKEFTTQWESTSDSRCALITPGRLDQAKVQMELTRYLPQSKVSQVRVTRSLQGRARD
ncbi:MAG: hypothetical protein OXN17_09190 [Candidatus Poribacteria bacterium]|nr:hypothetical protein [Candidatus Poribacteria bacterium]MDE0506250.1 hypothetical protein [Candidatus Poribacteria bacterium]